MYRRSRMLFLAGLTVTLAGSTSRAALTDSVAPDKAATGSSTTTMSVNGCDFTVTYAWNGFQGKNLTASFGVSEHTATWDISIVLENVEGQAGSSGSLTHTFSLTPNAHAARTIIGRGALINSRKYTDISGSSSASKSSTVSTCG